MTFDLHLQRTDLRHRIADGEMAGIGFGLYPRITLGFRTLWCWGSAGRRRREQWIVGEVNKIVRDERPIMADGGDVGVLLVTVAIFLPQR